MQYRKYPTSAEVPHRNTRKKMRREIFWENKFLKGRLKADRKKVKHDNPT